ncbi:MAG: UbiX family flavin prenyltransferase [Candidatus Omnitrophica bacterium]|nr:UbiX family flavin prenyltransferase [Candidatus Omnitrophota bacterium]
MAGFPLVVAITGASGIMYGVRMVEVLSKLKRKVFLMITKPARKVMEVETSLKAQSFAKENFWEDLFDPAARKYITYFDYQDVSTIPASGSYRTGGMIVAPCSGATLSAIAHGSSRDLVERAAEVTIKEGRKLILVLRETPLSAIYIENMLKLARIGVHILPASPAFYQRPEEIGQLYDFIVGRVLDLMEIEHNLFKRWSKS